MKPYHQVPIQDCGEPLVAIPLEEFAAVIPHPYAMLGAPYGDRSPYCVRSGVLVALRQAQQILQQFCPGWRIQLFDAYRPVAVQQFMVEYTFADLVRQRGLTDAELSAIDRDRLLAQVFEFWAPPNLDPAAPPPHSTGAAVDVTLVDASGAVIDMGSPIDEVSVRSHPDHFATAPDPTAQGYHHHRQYLRHCFVAAGFHQHPKEWWHFSLGDQLWAWQHQQHTGKRAIARYGRVEPCPQA